MMRIYLKHLFAAIALVLVQAFVLQGVHFWGWLPMLYVYAMLRWPSEMPVYQELIAGFLLGLAVDVLNDSLGLHCVSTTLIAYLRQPILRLCVSRLSLDNVEPGEKTLGFLVFWKYTLSLLCCHHFCVYLIEAFSFLDILSVLWKSMGSVLLTALLIFLLERFRS